IIDGSQFPPGHRSLDSGLKGRRLGYAPGETGQRRENSDVRHQLVRSIDPLRIALLIAATSAPPLLRKNRATSWLSIAETPKLTTTGAPPPLALVPLGAAIKFCRPWEIFAGSTISLLCSCASTPPGPRLGTAHSPCALGTMPPCSKPNRVPIPLKRLPRIPPEPNRLPSPKLPAMPPPTTSSPAPASPPEKS